MMRIAVYFILCLTTIATAGNAAPDSAYIHSFGQKISISAFTARSTLQLHSGQQDFIPNSPLTLGLGIAVKNTFINLRQAVPVWQPAGPGSKAGGSTSAFDLQLHQYTRNLIIDMRYQEYRGFYYIDQGKEHYANMYIKQAGLEATYIFKAKRFSAKAAFEQSEQQLRSAGSWVAGANIALAQLQELQYLNNSKAIDNVQAGLSLGYAYTWIIDPRWQLSAIATAGLNLGNEWQQARKAQLNVYPTGLARCSAGYHQPLWSLSWSMYLRNNAIDSGPADPMALTAINMQMTYVRRFDKLQLRRKTHP